MLNISPTKAINWETPIRKLQQLAGVNNYKPNLIHLQMYSYRTYPVDQSRQQLDYMNPRSDIGYLVRYQASNIFRIWITSCTTVITTKDVKFNKTKFYNPEEDILFVVQQRSEILDFPRITKILDNNENTTTVALYEGTNEDTTQSHTHVIEKTSQQQDCITGEESLITPDQTPFPEDQETQQDDSDNKEPVMQKNSTQREFCEIGLNLDQSNIVTGPRNCTKRIVHLAVIQQDLGSFRTAFHTVYTFQQPRIHRSMLLPSPKNWKEVQTHSYKKEFEAAAQQEYDAMQPR